MTNRTTNTLRLARALAVVSLAESGVTVTTVAPAHAASRRDETAPSGFLWAPDDMRASLPVSYADLLVAEGLATLAPEPDRREEGAGRGGTDYRPRLVTLTPAGTAALTEARTRRTFTTLRVAVAAAIAAHARRTHRIVAEAERALEVADRADRDARRAVDAALAFGGVWRQPDRAEAHRLTDVAYAAREAYNAAVEAIEPARDAAEGLVRERCGYGDAAHDEAWGLAMLATTA